MGEILGSQGSQVQSLLLLASAPVRQAHTGISLCPLKILSVGRPWLTTCSLSPDFLLRAAHFRKEEPQWAPGIENTISTSEIGLNRAPWDTGSEFSFSLGWGFWGEFSSQFSEGQTEKKSSPEIHLRQVVRRQPISLVYLQFCLLLLKLPVKE